MPSFSLASRVAPAHFKRLLLVEDEVVNREILTALLEQEGYQVESAGDGRAALEILRGDKNFGLVIADRLMPRLDGLGLFAAMKKDPQLSDIPLIMQTGATAPDEIAQGIKAGVYYYLSKPYEKPALLALVKSSLRERLRHHVFLQDHANRGQTLSAFKQGRFEIHNLDDAQTIAIFLGSLFPRPELAVFGLYELLLNAIEHGALQVGFEEKARLLALGMWEQEIHQRLSLPVNKNRRTKVDFNVDAQRIQVTITDPGPGFDHRPYLEIEPARATRANGRGIAKANLLSFDQIVYKSPGNQVSVSAAL